MAGAGIEVEIVKALQLLNALEGGWAERRLSVESMEHDTFQKIAEGHIVVLGKSFQDFEQAFFHPDAGLDTFYQQFLIIDHVYQCTRISWYTQPGNPSSADGITPTVAGCL